MKLFLAFSGEGTTDHRFIPIIIERIIKDYFLNHNVTAEFSWINLSKKGTSHDNIINNCIEAIDYHLVFFHRDSGNLDWNQAYENHFFTAEKVIAEDNLNKYNKNLIPVIPVTETEAWMLPNKQVLKNHIETTLSDNNLNLVYRTNRIELIKDPKSVIEKAIEIHNKTLTSKQRRYAVKIGDLYDSLSSDIPMQDLDNLDSFIRLKNNLHQKLNFIIANQIEE